MAIAAGSSRLFNASSRAEYRHIIVPPTHAEITSSAMAELARGHADTSGDDARADDSPEIAGRLGQIGDDVGRGDQIDGHGIGR